VKDAKGQSEINFYDSNTGELLFTAPKGRTMEEFLVESRAHGWPSFRGKNCGFKMLIEDTGHVPRLYGFDDFGAHDSFSHGSFPDAEVNWENVRILPDGETVSLAGTHLGHNLVSYFQL
jgi:hypothetical protein